MVQCIVPEHIKLTRKLTVTCICVRDFVVYSIRKKMAINFGGFIFTNLNSNTDVKSAYNHYIINYSFTHAKYWVN